LVENSKCPASTFRARLLPCLRIDWVYHCCLPWRGDFGLDYPLAEKKPEEVSRKLKKARHRASRSTKRKAPTPAKASALAIMS